MVRKLLILMALLLFATPGALAVTQVTVNTLENHDVTITLLRPGTGFYSIKSFPGLYTGLEGTVTVDYDDTETSFNIQVIVKKNGAIVLNEQYDGYDVGSDIELDVYPEGFEPPEKEEEVVEEVEEEVTEEEQETTSGVEEESGDATGVTGQAVSGSGDTKLSNTLFYAIGIVVLVLVIGLVMFNRMRGASPPHVGGDRRRGFGVHFGRRDGGEGREEVKFDNKSIEKAERRIREAQAEINKIKNQEKIKQAETKMQEYQEKLDRLKKGEEVD